MQYSTCDMGAVAISPRYVLLLLRMLIIWLVCSVAHAQEPFAVPTFHCMSLYWSPADGGDGRQVLVSYKESFDTSWREALPMRYNPISATSLDKADYRGSVVNLTPATMYDFKLGLEGSDSTLIVSMSTWSEEFPEGEVITVSSRVMPLEITEGGSSDAYIVYDGQGSTIDVAHQYNNCILISASYVIVRNFRLRGAGTGIGFYPPIGAIEIDDGVHDVVIEDCDISDFGRLYPIPRIPNHGYNGDCGIHFRPARNIERIIIQRNRIHHPTYTASNWDLGHALGPHGITMLNNKGNHVFRYNEFFSDNNRMFMDILSGGTNGSYEGVPGPDSDIYCNYFSHALDDAIETEGGVENVRIWNNYITQAPCAFGNAPVSIGPLYIWRNVVNVAEWKPGGAAGRFIKMGFAGSEDFMSGHMYIFNNTAFQEDGKGVGQGIGGDNRIIKHCVTRNNIIHLRYSSSQSISTSAANVNNDFDYDLYNGLVPSGTEPNGIFGTPVYVDGAGFSMRDRIGNFQLSERSRGYDEGAVIPNFADVYRGRMPDIGAHENGWPDFRYGVRANFIPPDELMDTTVSSIGTVRANIPSAPFILHQNYPNPFRDRTRIDYELFATADIHLDVCDMLGNTVKRLVCSQQHAGRYSVSWNALDETSELVQSGLYFYRLWIKTGDSFSFGVKRMTVYR